MARKKLDTLTEPMYYVLLSLRQERHGYGIMQNISALTGGRVNVGAGTLYALLERFEKDALIYRTRVEENPVSYTHLDVYKRQAVKCVDIRRNTSGEGGLLDSN